MKILFDGHRTILSLGVSTINDTAMPFIGFVDASAHIGGELHGLEAPEAVDKMHELGGTVIFIENPEAAERLSFFLRALIDTALETEWSQVEHVGGAVN